MFFIYWERRSSFCQNDRLRLDKVGLCSVGTTGGGFRQPLDGVLDGLLGVLGDLLQVLVEGLQLPEDVPILLLALREPFGIHHGLAVLDPGLRLPEGVLASLGDLVFGLELGAPLHHLLLLGVREFGQGDVLGGDLLLVGGLVGVAGATEGKHEDGGEGHDVDRIHGIPPFRCGRVDQLLRKLNKELYVSFKPQAKLEPKIKQRSLN